VPQELRRQALTVIQPAFRGTAPPDWLRRLIGEGLGGVCLFARNTPDAVTAAAVTGALRAENPDVLVAADEEGGAVTRLESAHGSSWPGNAALGRVGDPALTGAVAAEMGAYLAAAGIRLAYAPTADVTSDPRNPVIGVRSFGTDAADVATHTAAFVAGLQSAGVAACAKHFPGHGDTSVDSHHALPVLDVDEATLEGRELAPFRAAIAAGVRTVMAGHLLVPSLDPDRPASLSAVLLTLLRRRLGFGGAIVTDALEMEAVAAGRTLPELAVRALAAGADLLCLGARATEEATVRAVADAVVAAVRSGELPAERLAEAADRVAGIALPGPAPEDAATGATASGSAAGSASSGGASGAAASGGASAARPGRSAYAALGALAAGRALELRGQAPRFDVPPVVATFETARTVAVGRVTPWGIADLLAERLPGTVLRTVTPETADPSALAEIAADHERPLVLVVRDAARHAWITAALARLLSARPDAGVVDMGLPAPDARPLPPQPRPAGVTYPRPADAAPAPAAAAHSPATGRPGAWHLATYGPSLASARAAVDLLLAPR
jgi:beta-N-acetylhexosaminidase